MVGKRNDDGRNRVEEKRANVWIRRMVAIRDFKVEESQTVMN